MERKPAALPAILKMKCPRCRKGNMFKNKSIFPLRNMMDMPTYCNSCKQKMEIEVGFYFGTGYVSYGLSIIIAVITAVLFALTVGFSVTNDSVYWYLGITIALLLLLQPWLMRISRVLYLWIFVRYSPSKANLSTNTSTEQA